MSVADNVTQARLNKMQSLVHAKCVVCGSSNARGLGLDFMLLKDGVVEADFYCDKDYEGYDNVLHGGVVSALLDGAMTNCMFANGCAAVTAELKVRFRHPVKIGQVATVRAWIERTSPPLYVVKAEVLQNHEVKATATAKFMDQPSLAAVPESVTFNG